MIILIDVIAREAPGGQSTKPPRLMHSQQTDMGRESACSYKVVPRLPNVDTCALFLLEYDLGCGTFPFVGRSPKAAANGFIHLPFGARRKKRPCERNLFIFSVVLFSFTSFPSLKKLLLEAKKEEDPVSAQVEKRSSSKVSPRN